MQPWVMSDTREFVWHLLCRSCCLMYFAFTAQREFPSRTLCYQCRARELRAMGRGRGREH